MNNELAVKYLGAEPDTFDTWEFVAKIRTLSGMTDVDMFALIDDIREEAYERGKRDAGRQYIEKMKAELTMELEIFEDDLKSLEKEK